MKKLMLLLLTLVITQLLFAQTIHYVQAGGTGDGSSWGNASGDLQAMLGAAQSGEQVWVAQGTYKPTSGTDRSISFVLKNGVAIYGGFAGGEAQLSQRNWQTNVTILSGAIGDAGTEDNSIHVVRGNSGTNSTAVLDGFTITGGVATFSIFSISLDDIYGGGMYNDNSSPTLANCTFSGNFANYWGGGMYNGNSSAPTLTNCTFSGNRTLIAGGGMYNDNSSPILTNCTFSGNRSDKGGGMYNFNSSAPVLTGCTFSGNSATGDGYGGGIYNDHSSPTLTYCTFSDNFAANYGGGMYNRNYSAPTLINCTFSGNRSDEGGGIYNDNSFPTLTNCTFSDNFAAPFGGGMYNEFSSAPRLTGCTFSGNNAAAGGGGMFNDHTSAPILTGCTFSGNSVGDWGGGMFNLGSSSPTLTNCIFQENSAYYGGGMYNSGSSPTLTNCTFSGNSAGYGGGGMGNEFSSAPRLTNCTFSGNRASVLGGGMYNLYSSAPTLTNCILWGDQGDEFYNESGTPAVTYSIVQGGYSGAGNKDQDPLFVNAANGNLHLQSCSPAIDAGNDAANTTTTDLDGNPRKVRTIDMGAYEYQGTPPTATIPDAKALSTGVDVNTVYVGYAPASSLTLQANAGGGSGPFTYQWSTGATTPSITVSPAATTTYTVTVSNGNCTAMAAKQVKVVDVRCGNKMDKVSVCHGGNTLCIDKTSVQAHLNHGDYLGSCTSSGSKLTGGEEQVLTGLSIQAAPNPSPSYFSLTVHSTNVKDRITLRVTDAVGRTMELRTVNAGETVQVGASYGQGMYVIEAVQGSSSVTAKLVKQ